MLIEIKIKIGHDIVFNINQITFKSTHLLDKMALVQFQWNTTVSQKTKLGHFLERVKFICVLLPGIFFDSSSTVMAPTAKSSMPLTT